MWGALQERFWKRETGGWEDQDLEERKRFEAEEKHERKNQDFEETLRPNWTKKVQLLKAAVGNIILCELFLQFYLKFVNNILNMDYCESPSEH